MLTPRVAIIAASFLFGLYVLGSVVSSVTPPESFVTGRHSYGTGRLGHRAIVETLDKLGIQVERNLSAPTADIPLETTLVFWEPNLDLVLFEPSYLMEVDRWVQQGGRVVIVSPAISSAEEDQLDELMEKLPHYDKDLLSLFGLKGVQTEVLFWEEIPQDTPEDRPDLVQFSVEWDPDRDGNPSVAALATEEETIHVLDLGRDIQAKWKLFILDAEQDQRLMAAAVEHGQGEVVLVAEPSLLSNVVLGSADNSLFAVWLLTDHGKRAFVLFDEFYHGLSVRGNPWWLLSRYQYAYVAFTGLLLLAIWIWRHGVLLGPPLNSRQPTRRDIGEYIDAMSRFFLRGRRTERFLLQQVRDGVWRELCCEFHVRIANRDRERLIAIIHRRDPQRAEIVRDALVQADQCLSTSRPHSSSRDILRAMHDLADCLPDRGSDRRPFRFRPRTA